MVSMDGPGGHYAKWNKSDRERQILCDITYMWNLKDKTNSTYKINKLQGYIVQYREYSQYFIITINGV